MLAVAATATLVACGNEKEPEYVPAEQPTTAEVYFPSSVTTSSVDLTDCKGTFEIPVYRVQKGEAQTISLTVSADPIFTVPATVEFAAGSDVSAVKVTFDDSKVVEDKKYKISLSLGSETSEYGLSAYEFTVVRPSQWLPWGKKDPDDSGSTVHLLHPVASCLRNLSVHLWNIRIWVTTTTTVASRRMRIPMVTLQRYISPGILRPIRFAFLHSLFSHSLMVVSLTWVTL